MWVKPTLGFRALSASLYDMRKFVLSVTLKQDRFLPPYWVVSLCMQAFVRLCVPFIYNMLDSPPSLVFIFKSLPVYLLFVVGDLLLEHSCIFYSFYFKQ